MPFCSENFALLQSVVYVFRIEWKTLKIRDPAIWYNIFQILKFINKENKCQPTRGTRPGSQGMVALKDLRLLTPRPCWCSWQTFQKLQWVSLCIRMFSHYLCNTWYYIPQHWRYQMLQSSWAIVCNRPIPTGVTEPPHKPCVGGAGMGVDQARAGIWEQADSGPAL